jgi:CRISPR-associated endonuclease Cas2
MSSYVAAYDVAHPGRRRQIAALLARYGRRVQRSVFEVWLEPAELPVLKRALGPLLDPADAFDLFPIDRRDPARRIRWQRDPYPDPVILVGDP